MAEENEAENNQKKSGGNTLLIVIVVLVFLILIGGGLGAFLLLSGGDDSSRAPQQQVASQGKRITSKRSENLLTIGPMYPMKQFIVNLLSESGNRFLKTSLDIELSDETLSAEMDAKQAAIRDIIIRTLSSKTFEEVSTMKGKDKLKDELVERINQVLADGQIRNIFFTDFVVQ